MKKTRSTKTQMTPADYLIAFKNLYSSGNFAQPPVGDLAAAYIFAAYSYNPADAALSSAAAMLIANERPFPFNLAFTKNDRNSVAKVCQAAAVDPIVAYCFVMAWGGQWDASSFSNFRKSIRNLAALRSNLMGLRHASLLSGIRGSNHREKAFELFATVNPIDGLGVSYFTKVLYFFMPAATRGFVLDKWTALSVSRLPWPSGIGSRPNNPGSAVAWKTGKEYDSYCRFVENLGSSLNWDPSDVELGLFGSPDTNSPGWRWRDLL